MGESGELMNRRADDIDRVSHLQRIAVALARDATPYEMAMIVVNECRTVLAADAVCIFLLAPHDQYELVAESGCTSEFIKEWRKVPKSLFSEFNEPCGEVHFGTAEEFNKKFPNCKHLADKSGREMIGYAPLTVENRSIGLLGFSYNKSLRRPLDRPFVSLLVNLCSQSLERSRLSEAEKAANRAKSEFLATINHEVRTPLSLIQGYTELLAFDSDLPPKQQRWASIVHRSTEQLVSLVGDVLDLTKIEAAGLEVMNAPFHPSEIVEDVRLAAMQKAAQRGLRFEVMAEGLPEILSADAARLRQILLNLISNSIKFTEHGFVRLRLKMITPDTLEAIVSDSGIGIAKNDQDRIFEPYTQVGCYKKGGTGLGLSISRAWARALGGDLALLRSEVGCGSEFLLTIPCRHCEPSDLQSTEGPNDLVGAKILAVDDSGENRELLQFYLEGQGAQVDSAATGHEAIEKALSNNYDVILMDIRMPGIDGIETVQRLRRLGYSGAVTALTADALKDHHDHALAIGFDDFLTKPICRKTLIQSIKSLLAARRDAEHL